VPAPETTLALLKLALASTSKAVKSDDVGRTRSPQRLHDYSHGEQWGNGTYWKGRRPKASSEGTSDLTEVRKLFTQDDQLGPALNRLVAGMLARDPEWDAERVTPAATATARPDGQDAQATGATTAGETEATDAELVEVVEALSTWHEDANLHGTLKDAAYGMLAQGRGFLRINIPREYALQGLAREGGATDLVSALELIHIHFVDATQAGVLIDEHGRQVGYYYAYDEVTDGRTRHLIELHSPEFIETYLWESNELTLISEEGGGDTPNLLYDPLRLRRPHYQMLALERDGGSALTLSSLDKQDALNVSWTNLRRNDDLAGFRSLILFNADEPVDEEGKPTYYRMGPSLVQNIRGVPLKVDASGNPEQVASPSALVVDPVDPDTFLKTIEALRLAILAEFDQTWTLADAKAVSGDSKKESRAAFEKRLSLEAPPIDRALAWALDTTYRLACKLAGQEPLALTFIPRLFLDVSKGDLASFQANVQAHGLGLASRETVVDSNPSVVDAGQELARLEQEGQTRNTQAASRDAAMAALLNR
jgi:hypothetical protein